MILIECFVYNNRMASLLQEINANERDKDIRFQEKGHIYYVKGKKGYTSVTTLVHNAFPKFNADKIIDTMMASPKWSESKYFGMTKSDIKKQWKVNGQEAAKMGTAMHLMFEYHYNQIHPEKIETYKDTIEYSYFHNFIKDHPELKAYRTEWTIFYEEYLISGSVDMVFYNEDDNTYSIYDWKRVKEIKKTGFGKTCLIPGLSHIHDANYWHYCFQLNIYKFILESKYDKKIRDLHLVVIHPENESNNYDKIKMPILPMDDILKILPSKTNP